MSWRVATSLDVALAEVNAHAPGRSKVSDGSIGDAAHATRSSDHNPWLNNTVRARDFTHDPAAGCDADVIATRVAGLLGRHPALGSGAYVIWSRRIISTARLAEGWRGYYGSNPHDKHVHVSVGLSGYDNPAPWNLYTTPTLEDDMSTYADQLDRIEEQNRRILKRLNPGGGIRDKLNRLIRQGKATRRELQDLADELEQEDARP